MSTTIHPAPPAPLEANLADALFHLRNAEISLATAREQTGGRQREFLRRRIRVAAKERERIESMVRSSGLTVRRHLTGSGQRR